ncbi:CDP-glycerol glycerophosphotransferase family protein [Blautia sp. LMAG:89]|uniref:CDP-glycerol glycerophosphotransferase family protein n=1 Tax=Blautia sp. LMAG:89 TaxID=1969173 RepID=UPI00257DAACE|nr:CDP-glycerol glycerophosphotransferase family protein [Blautia sp. LMAG:89]
MKNKVIIKIKKKLYNVVALPALKNLFRILPIAKNKIVFDNFCGKGYGGNPKYIAEAISVSNVKGLDMIWLVDNFMPDEERKLFPNNIRLVDNESIRGLFERATAQIWVDNVRHYHPIKKRTEQIYLQTWHGSMGAKRIEKDAENLLPKEYVKEAKYDGSITDAIIADNYLQEQIYLRAFWLNPDTEILRFGFPQNDVIERDKNNSSKIDCLKNTLFINSQIYYVLYAPTFRDDFSTEGYNIDFERVIKAFEIRMKKKTKIIIRLHPNVAFQKEKIRFSENILDGTDYPNMQDLALVCDAVISDYSSTLFDFSMLDKPAFVCALDYKEYEEKRGFIPEFYEFPFPFATSNNELINVIQKYDEKEYKDNISSFYSKYPTYCDGHSSKRVCDWILNHMV